MYFVERRVSFSETGTDYKVKLTKILDYFQDTTILQSEELGVGVKPLRDRDFCWVLSSWQVVINRYPEFNEKIIIGTAPYDFKGFMGSRNFLLKTEDGEILAMANSIWSFIDIKKQSLVKVPEDVIASYNTEQKLDMDYAPRKIKLPEDMVQLDPIIALYHNIDINNHVNNAQYIAIAEDLIPEGRRAKQMRAEYRVSARFGETIVPYVHVNEEKNVYTVSLADEQKNPYVIVEFTI